MLFVLTAFVVCSNYNYQQLTLEYPLASVTPDGKQSFYWKNPIGHRFTALSFLYVYV